MGLFSRSKSYLLKPAWRFKAVPGKIIWRLLISPTGVLAGEERDPENKTSSLFAIDVPTGNVLWRNITIDEAWWFHTALITAENIYVHRFRKPDMPEPLGIITLDAATGALKWEQPDVAMLFEYGGKVYAQRDALGRKEFFALDSKTGEVLEAFGSERDNILSLERLVQTEDVHSQYSLAIRPDDEIFGEIRNVLTDVMNLSELRGAIDFTEYADNLVVSYHERITNDAEAALGNLLSNHLTILAKESGDILYQDVLNKKTPYPVGDNFFIHRGILIYVKETTEIIGIPLG